MDKNIIKRKALSSLTSADKWDILDSYISNKLTNQEIADKYEIPYKVLEKLIRTTYARFQNTRESKLLLATVSRPDVFETMKTKFVDCEQINQSFLEKLSEPTDILTDSELIFCELLLEYGDDLKAVEKSKLNVGLKKNYETKANYEDSLRIRAFYLKRKPNIQLYLNEQNRKNLSVLSNGKEFIQSNLISMIEQLKNNNDPRNLPSQLKAIESLGRTFGAFEDKVTIDSSNGDDVLDRILKKAKQVKGELIELEDEEDEIELS